MALSFAQYDTSTFGIGTSWSNWFDIDAFVQHDKQQKVKRERESWARTPRRRMHDE